MLEMEEKEAAERAEGEVEEYPPFVPPEVGG
jgi:hypothetical protein